MKLITLDTEQEAMLDMAFAGIDVFLQARAARRDPGGFVSRGAQLQRRKVDNLRRQLRQGAIAQFHQMGTDAQAQIVKLCASIAHAQTVHARSLMVSQLVNVILYQRLPPEPPHDPITGEIEGPTK